jgi:cobalt/nickel transport system permease protein
LSLGSGRGNFIEHSILGILSFLKESVFSEEYALRKGFLQSISPTLKVASMFLFVLAALFIKTIIVLVMLYLICILLTLFSGIQLRFFIKRTWIFIPLFSLFIAIPALFNTFTPGETLFTLHLMGAALIITRQGLYSAGLFFVRVLTCVSFVILLGLATRHSDFLSALRNFRIPQIFVMTLGMCYRYIYLFVEIIENTYLGIKSRVGTKLHYKKGQRIVAWNIAGLWQRSILLNEEVYNAMLSRGYTGEPRSFVKNKAGFRDWAWLACVVVISAMLIYLGHSA